MSASKARHLAVLDDALLRTERQAFVGDQAVPRACVHSDILPMPRSEVDDNEGRYHAYLS